MGYLCMPRLVLIGGGGKEAEGTVVGAKAELVDSQRTCGAGKGGGEGDGRGKRPQGGHQRREIRGGYLRVTDGSLVGQCLAEMLFVEGGAQLVGPDDRVGHLEVEVADGGPMPACLQPEAEADDLQSRLLVEGKSSDVEMERIAG